MPFDVVLRGIFSALFVASVIRISTPLILAALGGLISDLAGVINIALEGIMLVAAFTGVVVSAYTQSVWLGVLGGVVVGTLFSLILAYFHLKLQTDIILAGIATPALAYGFSGEAGFSPAEVSWTSAEGYEAIEIPGFMRRETTSNPEGSV